VPDCTGKECGGDGCNGLCGECGCGEDCTVAGLCLFTACAGKECGPDGCGGKCGACPSGQYCVAGSCPSGNQECEDGNEEPWDGCNAGKLSEFAAATTTALNQENPATAALDDGRYLIAWQSDEQDGSGAGVFARMFEEDGQAYGGEFQINTATYGAQKKPAAAALPGGGFIVVWESSGQDGFLEGIFAQRFSAGGLPLDGEFQVNAMADFAQTNPNVATFGDGSFIISWQTPKMDGSDEAAVARRYNADGLPLGPEAVLNTMALGNQHVPRIAPFQDSGWLAAWASFQQDGNGWGIFAQLFESTGVKKGFEFQVNTESSQHQYAPGAAALEAGGFVVVWQSLGQDGADYSIYGQRFGASNKAGEEFLVHDPSPGKEEAPEAGHVGSGAFVVVWQSCPSLEGGPGADGDGCGVLARVFDKKGVALAGELLLHEWKAQDQSNPSLAVFASGTFLVAWQSCPPAYAPADGQDGDSCGIYARRFTKTGANVYH
jgi:hypothetical protein